LALLRELDVELVILARYMQVLSAGFLEQLGRPVITSTIRSCRLSPAGAPTTRPMSAGSS